MKIGILTQQLHTNYGGLLQNYALQQILTRGGHQVETIDWRFPNSLRVKLSRLKWAIMPALFPQIYSKKRYPPTNDELAIIQSNTNHFIQSYIRHTYPIRNKQGFKVQSDKGHYDAYIVGSDQCWRPKYNIFLSTMFLDFVEGKQVKRIAYGASFGTDDWEFSSQQTAQCAPLAQKFDLVTVREDSGVRLCKNYLGVDAVHVLDPTLLLTKDDYINLVREENEPQAKGTLFNYILDPDTHKTAFIENVAEFRGLKAFQVLPKYLTQTRTREDVKKHTQDCVFPSVTAWLRAFMDAEMTIVDSFHGMVFSIIFNKPFWVIGNVERGLSRFTSLLKVFHLEDRLLDPKHLDDVDVDKPINWESVNAIMAQKRNECLSLLLNELSK